LITTNVDKQQQAKQTTGNNDQCPQTMHTPIKNIYIESSI